MTRQLRNRAAVAAIIAYCMFALAFASLPSVRDIGLAVLGLLEIAISAAYLRLNRPLARNERKAELVSCGVILVAIAFVGLQYLVQ